MKRLTAACAALVLTGCVAPGMGMMNPMGAMTDTTTADTVAQGDDVMASMDAAKAAANRPGDEALTCDQLQMEMRVMFEDPAFRSTVTTMQAQAETQMDKAKSAQAGAVAAAGTSMALGIAGSFIPGMSWLSQGAMMAQQAAMTAQAKEANKGAAEMMTNMSTLMPQMMRGQRINDLATEKNCAFIKAAKPA